jgi:GT2 family glycosyltransferase
VDSILADPLPAGSEIVVVDDASSDGSLEFLKTPEYSGKPIRTARNDERRGLIFSRALAADLARGRYLVILDAHCAVEPGWLEVMAGELAGIGDRGLVVPMIYGLRPEDWALDLEKGGADGCTISTPFLDFAWTAPVEIEGRLSTCTIGGGAWMTSREWYQHLGGLDRGMVYWGGENVDFPLRTWLAGGACLVASAARVGHLFRTTPLSQMAEADSLYNKIRVAHNAFSAETFERVMESLLHLVGFREAISRIHAERKELGAIKDRFESIRRRQDRWLTDTFRLPLFEPAFFHIAPRRKGLKPARTPRPLVSVVALIPSENDGVESLVSAVLDKTTYGNCELVLAREERSAGPPSGLDRAPWRGNPRLRFLSSSASLEGGALENLAAGESEAEYLAFLPPGGVILDPHWLEKLLLLAERRPRLLFACPRTCRLGEDGRPAPGEDRFDALWDWDAPLFSRDRQGVPLSEAPYQALSCPETLLLVQRNRFLSLGGFDRTVRRGPRPMLDLAVAGWLAGYETFCHPGLAFGLRKAAEAAPAQPPDAVLERWREYAQVLPAAKRFSDPLRQRRCLTRSMRAQALVLANERRLERERREFLSRAKFDDDWLFFKFSIGDGR